VHRSQVTATDERDPGPARQNGAMRIDRKLLFGLATSTAWERSVRATTVGERLARRAANRYVAGDTAREALALAERLSARGVAVSVDFFGEFAEDDATADRVAEEYFRLADSLEGTPAGTWLAVDLSHLGLDVDQQRCAERLLAIARGLPPGRQIQVGAEDLSRVDAVLECVLGAAEAGPSGSVGATVQANFRRSAEDLERLIAADVPVRLVKGAYLESATRAHPYGEPTDIAFIRLAHRLAEAGADFTLATHDGVVREALLAALGPRPVEQLLGVRPENLDDLLARGVPVRVYAAYGPDWFRYWMRRVAEARGA
jgi:proline dehydrogenase